MRVRRISSVSYLIATKIIEISNSFLFVINKDRSFVEFLPQFQVKPFLNTDETKRT